MKKSYQEKLQKKRVLRQKYSKYELFICDFRIPEHIAELIQHAKTEFLLYYSLIL